MYIGSYDIDDALTFYANTHDPATAGQVDADAVPGYRIYEDETGTPLLTGSMAKLDDANTTGYYSEQVTLSAANGFERGKCYNIRITGVVGGVTAVVLRQFQVAAKVDLRAAGGTTVSAWSTTRGLAGTALPAAAADAAGGLPISDAGGLDLDAQIGSDIDAIKAKTDNLPSDPADESSIQAAIADVEGKVDDLESRLGTPSDLGSGATVAANLVDIEAETDDWNDGQRLDLLLDAVKAKTDNLPSDPADQSAVETAITNAQTAILAQLPSVPLKNTEFTYVIKMFDSSDHVTPKTGLTITMTRSLDGAAFASATGAVTEISSGHYKVVATQADMNADNVVHRFAATGADDLSMEFKTVS